MCDESTIICNLAERGNTASTSHFVAVNDNIFDHRIVPGERVIFSITASGLNVGTALYTFDDLPDRLRRNEKPQKIPSSRKKDAYTPPDPSSRVRIASIGTIPVGVKVNKETKDLVELAVEDCLRKSSYNRSNIDLLIFTGTYRTDFIGEPAIAAIIAGKLQINDDIASQSDKKTFAFDVLNGAMGFLNACYIGVGMIKARKLKNIMIVASEIENNAETRPEELRSIKETGSALLLEEDTPMQGGFGNFVFKDFPSYIDAFTAYTIQESGKTSMHFKGDPNIEDYYLQCINETVGELLTSEHVTLSQIKVIFPPQISSTFISRLSDEMHMSRDKFVDIVYDEKDFFTSSLAYALQHAYEQKLVKTGDIGLIINVGTGIQVGCAIYYF